MASGKGRIAPLSTQNPECPGFLRPAWRVPGRPERNYGDRLDFTRPGGRAPGATARRPRRLKAGHNGVR